MSRILSVSGRDKDNLMFITNNIQLKQLAGTVFTLDEAVLFIVGISYDLVVASCNKRKFFICCRQQERPLVLERQRDDLKIFHETQGEGGALQNIFSHGLRNSTETSCHFVRNSSK